MATWAQTGAGLPTCGAGTCSVAAIGRGGWCVLRLFAMPAAYPATLKITPCIRERVRRCTTKPPGQGTTDQGVATDPMGIEPALNDRRAQRHSCASPGNAHVNERGTMLPRMLPRTWTRYRRIGLNC